MKFYQITNSIKHITLGEMKTNVCVGLQQLA